MKYNFHTLGWTFKVQFSLRIYSIREVLTSVAVTNFKNKQDFKVVIR